MAREPDWDGYRVLLGVASHGSFTAAARALGQSQPTVGRKIAALEAALGARLLVRRARGVALTPAGEEVVAEARRMETGAIAAARRAYGQSAGSAPVRVTATEGLGTLWLPRALRPLLRADPTLRVVVDVDNAPVDLASRRADVAVRLFRPREPDLVARRVATLGFGLFGAPSYLAERGTPRRLSDLARHDVIGFAEGQRTPSYLRWLRRVVPDERFVYGTSNLVAQHEAARAGLGLVVATRALLAGDPRLRRVLPRARIPSMDVWLAVHVDVRRNARVARVFDHLVATFAAEAAAFG